MMHRTGGFTFQGKWLNVHYWKNGLSKLTCHTKRPYENVIFYVMCVMCNVEYYYLFSPVHKFYTFYYIYSI